MLSLYHMPVNVKLNKKTKIFTFFSFKFFSGMLVFLGYYRR